MNIKRINTILFFLSIFLIHHLIVLGKANKPSRTILKKEWSKLTNKKEFGYKNKIEINEIKRSNASSNFISRWISKALMFLASPTGKNILWQIIVVAACVALYKILYNEKTWLLIIKNNQLKPKVIEDEFDDNLNQLVHQNWNELLVKASNENNEQLIIRYGYLTALQMLWKNGLIQFKIEKTNADYYQELKQEEIKKHFRNISNQYEIVWYGAYPINQQKTEQFHQSFHELSKILEKS